MRNIRVLANLALVDLAMTFQLGFVGPVDLVVLTLMQFFMLEGPAREGILNTEIAKALKLDTIRIMKVNSTSTIKDVREATGSMLALE